MSYEDLEEARKKRAEKGNAKATAGKGKRVRKRKCPESDPNEGQGQEVDQFHLCRGSTCGEDVTSKVAHLFLPQLYQNRPIY
jgi:hypothetical protein